MWKSKLTIRCLLCAAKYVWLSFDLLLSYYYIGKTQKKATREKKQIFFLFVFQSRGLVVLYMHELNMISQQLLIFKRFI